MEEPLISIIVPVYNIEQYLNRCVNSIVGQSYWNLEIILVDDGSTDHCPDLCDAWAEQDNRIKVIHKTNGGLSDARNKGMEIASGEFIGFVDSDDWIDSQMYEKLLTAIKRDESDIAACSVQMVWKDGSLSRMLTKQINCVINKQEAQAELLIERKLKQPVWYKLYRQSIIRCIPFEVGKCHEDVYWSYQAIGNADKISIIDSIGYYYWQHEDSIMGAGYSLKRLDVMEAYCNRYKYIKQLFPALEKQALCAIWKESIYNGQMAFRYLQSDERKKVFEYLSKVLKNYRLRYADYSDMKISHKVWISMARVSLRSVCIIKNILGIGF